MELIGLIAAQFFFFFFSENRGKGFLAFEGTNYRVVQTAYDLQSRPSGLGVCHKETLVYTNCIIIY
jgi:hypothetical protein